MHLKTVISILLFVVSLCQQQCNNTHFDYFSDYILGKQDQFNKTFTLIQNNFPKIPDIVYQATTFTKYTIFDIDVKFNYRDSRQKGQVIDDVIIVYGGQLQIDFSFKWESIGFTGKVNGTGNGFGISNDTIFGKTMKYKDGFYNYQLEQVYNVTFYSNFQINRIDPPKVLPQDILALKTMINHLEGQKSVKDFLQDHINLNLSDYLSQCLHDQKYKPIQYYDYTWIDPIKGKLVVNYTIHPTGVTLKNKGIIMTYTAILKDFPDFKCGDFQVPSAPYNKSEYGGTQEFLSYTLFDNTIRYARQMKFLNTELNKNNWESRFFQFYAGDLYQIIPATAENFIAIEPVTGLCEASKQNYFFKKGSISSVNVTLRYICYLQIKAIVVANFTIDLQIQVQGRPNAQSIDFHVIEFSQIVRFLDNQSYQVKNQDLAKLMIKHSLNRLIQHKVLGSGWALYTKDYPHFQAEQKYSLIYDSTHIGKIHQI